MKKPPAFIVFFVDDLERTDFTYDGKVRVWLKDYKKCEDLNIVDWEELSTNLLKLGGSKKINEYLKRLMKGEQVKVSEYVDEMSCNSQFLKHVSSRD